MEQKRSTGGSYRSLMTIGNLYSFLYCMMASNVLLSMPILGGTLFLTGQSAVMFSQLQVNKAAGADYLSRGMRRLGTALLILIFILLLALMMIYPIGLENADFWRLAGLVLCIILRPSVTRYVLERGVLKGKKSIPLIGRAALVHLAFLPPLMLMLLWSPLSREVVWYLLGGFMVSGMLECFSLGRARSRLQPWTEEEKQEMQALRGVHAYRIFQNMTLMVTAALQVTMVIAYTYIAVTAQALIVCMAIALLCTYVAYLVAGALLKRPLSKDSDPNVLLMLGLVLFFYGLMLFIRCLERPASVMSYVSLAFCTMGATACVRVLVQMEDDMRRVAAFGIGHTPSTVFDQMQQMRIDFATLMGQMVGLLGLVLICVFTANTFPDDWETLFRSVSPLLTLPALALVAAAVLFAILFPLTKEHLGKLRRYMELQKQGKENAALHAQLEEVVVRRSLKHYGVKLIILILRPLYFHRIRGKENIQLDQDIPCVFVCNHGEIYGPIVTNLYVPFSFRPWVTYEMMDRKAIADRVCNGTLQNIKGPFKPVVHYIVDKVAAPFLAWIMKSVESIPVYHDNPRKLMQTFRETTAAMEAGDNILLFPENADTSADHRYQREGVSEFFTGFTMIGQLYNKKTGKCPQFIPLYADRHKRIITFGVPTRYNPDVPANDEKERLCTYLRGEMMRLAGIKEENQPESDTD